MRLDMAANLLMKLLQSSAYNLSASYDDEEDASR